MDRAGNTNWMGMLCTIDLLVPTCLVPLLCINKIFQSFKAKWANLEWRPIVLDFPFKLVFPGKSLESACWEKKLNFFCFFELVRWNLGNGECMRLQNIALQLFLRLRLRFRPSNRSKYFFFKKMKVFNQFSNLGLGRQGLLYYTGKRRDVFTRATRQKRKRRVKNASDCDRSFTCLGSLGSMTRSLLYLARIIIEIDSGLLWFDSYLLHCYKKVPLARILVDNWLILLLIVLCPNDGLDRWIGRFKTLSQIDR
jgi:hypothetical protein